MNDVLERIRTAPAKLDHNPETRRIVEAQSQKVHYTQLAGLLQAKLNLVAERVYERTSGGQWWNVDPATCKLLLPLPWATYSHKSWGLYRSEADLLRLAVTWLRVKREGPAWYDEGAKRWFWSLGMYPDLHSLQATPGAWSVTPDLLRVLYLHSKGQLHGNGTGQGNGKQKARGKA